MIRKGLFRRSEHNISEMTRFGLERRSYDMSKEAKVMNKFIIVKRTPLEREGVTDKGI
jgi:hypothetical protein